MMHAQEPLLQQVKGQARRVPVEESEGSSVRVALVGGGAMARHHARALLRVNGARVLGVAEPDDEVRKGMLELCGEADGYPDLAHLLREHQVDVVHVCTPPATHAAIARLALEHDAHVYVEKPFAHTASEARELLSLADSRNLLVCAGHQLLYEAPSRRAVDLLPALGTVVHLESYFAFRQVRSGRDGGPALSPELQLLDILPHPVYLLLAFLEAAVPGEGTKLEMAQVGRTGTIHALLRRGDLTGNLVVTLGGRPVDNFLRLVGTNGSLHADYVRGTVQRSVGPGSSGVDKALQPYRIARQLVGGTTVALSRRILKRQKSYPGLKEIFHAFYGSVSGTAPAPMTPESILETVRVCEEIGEILSPRSSSRMPAHRQEEPESPCVLVTGGTGFVGREVVRSLVERGARVRALARRPPPPWAQVQGVEYAVADLGEGVHQNLLDGVDAVIHCAAETSGGWDAHERNSVRATEHLIRGVAEAEVRRVVHVSSIAVLEGSGPLVEDTPLETGKGLGPYVWGKAESERLATNLGRELGIQVPIVRPGAIVDGREFEPPGRLGRRIGNIFVAVGSPRDSLGVVDVRDVAQLLAWMALDPERAPKILNLIDPKQPSKRDLVRRLRKQNPGLWVVWLPRFLLIPLSWFASLAQKVLRPGKPAINVAEVFGARGYDAGAVSEVWEHAKGV